MIQFQRETCGNLEAALHHEWLETNGLGGFASSTIIGLNTRRYHGLLVAATKPPVGRAVLLSKLEETLLIDGQPFALSANRYPGVVHPQGFRYLKQFCLDPFPVFTYEVEGIEIEKTVFMVHGENTTVVQYKLRRNNQQPESPKDLRLEIRPLIAFRDYHSTTRENGVIDSRVEQRSGLMTITPYQGLPSLHIAHDAAKVLRTAEWYRNFEYDRERERGLDFTEDLFNPVILQFDLGLRPEAGVIAGTEPRDVTHAIRYQEARITRHRKARLSSPVRDSFAEDLTVASEEYIVRRGEQNTVIAGYHWFSDWGRDAMISLHGLTLATGKHEVARGILKNFAEHVHEGILPNRFPDAGEAPEYNTVDATLWFFEAARAFLDYTNNLEFVRDELYAVFRDIIAWHARGTRHGIKVDDSGLLASGAPDVQLTWMDARVGDWIVTPRRGKPVEIQALWYNALCIMGDLARKLEDQAGQKQYGDMATVANRSFNRLFWNESGGCLYDVVNSGPPDTSIRPNQIFAVSLPHGMLSKERARRVVKTVQEHLLTPYGLRSLAPSDPQYRGHYGGGPGERDGAYHQGTVWPWLLGPFLTAYIKVEGVSEASRLQAEAWLSPIKAHLAEAGLGQISEIFEGDPPHRPCGCIAQAWSVAEILRAYVQDVRGILPPAQSERGLFQPKDASAGAKRRAAAHKFVG